MQLNSSIKISCWSGNSLCNSKGPGTLVKGMPRNQRQYHQTSHKYQPLKFQAWQDKMRNTRDHWNFYQKLISLYDNKNKSITDNKTISLLSLQNHNSL